ncbi:hypothetical protein OMCYN_01767 [cyanobiont of Ornithocercus magnificus]|nr:hypothetical protein OMCYN_01767 [cyanobiont of Ornithocercus magnificus]
MKSPLQGRRPVNSTPCQTKAIPGLASPGISSKHWKEWQTSSVATALISANVQTLTSSSISEALAGAFMEQLGGHASQYVTGPARKLLAALEPLSEAGGWWCSGLDPLDDWAPMEWGQFKSDRPRQKAGKVLKYEAPIGQPTRSTWLRVPASVAQLVAERFELLLPAEAQADATGDSGAFWRWVMATPRLPVVITEGAKKAGALLSIGLPAVALPGVHNGAKRIGEKGFGGCRSGPIELLCDLAAFNWSKRNAWVLFDWSSSERGRRDVRCAANRLGRCLRAAGAQVRVGTCPGPDKGVDDHLAAGGTWERLAAALKPLTIEPELPRLRCADVIASAGRLLEHCAPIPSPEAAPLVAMAAPMGSGKTRSTAAAVAPFLSEGIPIISLTHRTSLGRAQAELLGLPWAEEAKPGSWQRNQGLGMCFDSACPSSALRINAAEWRGCDGHGPVVVLDEWCQGLEHLLFSSGTAVAERRVEVLETVTALLRNARQVIASDAQLSGPALKLLEGLTGRKAHLISSEHQPFASRRLYCPEGLTNKQASERAHTKLVELIADGKPFFCWTTAQRAKSKNSAQNLAAFHLRKKPAAKVLVIDSESPDDAARLAANPDKVAAEYDAIYCTPAISSGLSIELVDRFAAVLIVSGGTVAPEHVAQAAARVRDSNCPVWCFAPERSPGDQLRIGSGDTTAAAILKSLRHVEPQLIADLITAGYDLATSNCGPWLQYWIETAASRNRARLAYSATIRGLCQREGWQIIAEATPTDESASQAIGLELEGIAAEAQAIEDQAVIDAAPISDVEASSLSRRRRLNNKERAALKRYRVAKSWGLGREKPTAELLSAHRDRFCQRLGFGWLLNSLEARQQVAVHDNRRREQLAPNGRAWLPDLVRELLGHKVAAADALGLPSWLNRQEWFAADDPNLLKLQATAEMHRSDMRQVLGVGPGKRASGTLRSLLRLCGHRLESRRAGRDRGRVYEYRIRPEPLPAGAAAPALQRAWFKQLAGSQTADPIFPFNE